MTVGQICQFFDAYYIAERLIVFCRFSDSSLVSDLTKIQKNHELAVRERPFLDITRLNALFHGRIAQASGNEYVRTFSGRLHGHARRLSYYVYSMEAEHADYLQGQQKHVAADHDKIIDAIRSADRDLLMETLGRHARRFQDRITRFVDSKRGLEFPF